MAYEAIIERHLAIHAFLIPCAHLCRYCCISSAAPGAIATFGIPRFHRLTDRFETWGHEHHFRITRLDYASDDITPDVADFLDERLGPVGTAHDVPLTPKEIGIRIGTVRTGGARFRDDDGIRAWLSRWRDAGSTIVHGSFAGYGAVHDWWNNREGDYAFLMRVQQIAAEMGFILSQTIFLMRNMVPDLDRLIEDLDRLPIAPRCRHLLPVAYLGRARSPIAQEQRLTTTDRTNLAQRGAAFELAAADWKTEAEWTVMFDAEGVPPARHALHLGIDDNNIGEIENEPCATTVSKLGRAVESAYAALPSREELVATHADLTSTRVYGSFEDAERVWAARMPRGGHQMAPRLTHLQL